MVMTPQHPSDIESSISPGKTDHAAVVEHRPAEGGLLAMLEGDGDAANGDLDHPGGSAANAHQ